MSKGSKRRPELIDKELSELRWRLAFGKIDDSEKQKIKREIEKRELLQIKD